MYDIIYIKSKFTNVIFCVPFPGKEAELNLKLYLSDTSHK